MRGEAEAAGPAGARATSARFVSARARRASARRIPRVGRESSATSHKRVLTDAAVRSFLQCRECTVRGWVDRRMGRRRLARVASRTSRLTL